MAGIYLHIPFCRKACTYCDFHFSTVFRQKADLVAAMAQEMALKRDFFPSGKPIQTLYFGGGTPSVLDAEELSGLMASLRSNFDLSALEETTLEANPDDLSPEYLKVLREQGIDRLSIGIQSFREADLRLMNRSHSAEQALGALRNARQAGFENLSLDLIYGIPGLSEEDWLANIDQALDLNPTHISAYALTVEDKTVLEKQVRKGEVVIPADPVFTSQFHLLSDRLQEAGFEHYELSNFARPGFRSRHNSSYWAGATYLGIGPAAHSFRPYERIYNVPNNARYIRELQAGRLPLGETESLSLTDRFNEFLMVRLRTVAGFTLEELAQELGTELNGPEWAEIQSWAKQGWAVLEGSQVRLSREGWMISDHLIGSLFRDAD